MTEIVYRILADYLKIDRDSINNDCRLVRDLGLTSLDVINIVILFEDKFNIEVEDHDIERLQTVGDVVSLVEMKTDK